MSPSSTTTQSPPFSGATFIYDGDGKRVAQTINGVTTYFIGSHYEVTGSTVTKYYFAGSQRIAMRSGGMLYYLLGDHLGSTSITTNASGAIVAELRYKAWGETRYASGTTPTQNRYTSQFSYEMEFGLYFYNARWVDVNSGRFTQPDTLFAHRIDGGAICGAIPLLKSCEKCEMRTLTRRGHKRCAIVACGIGSEMRPSVESRPGCFAKFHAERVDIKSPV